MVAVDHHEPLGDGVQGSRDALVVGVGRDQHPPRAGRERLGSSVDVRDQRQGRQPTRDRLAGVIVGSDPREADQHPSQQNHADQPGHALAERKLPDRSGPSRPIGGGPTSSPYLGFGA